MVEKIRNPKSFRRWQKDKPHEWAQIIVLRSILRALPAISRERDNAQFHLAMFRAVWMSWAANKVPRSNGAVYAAAASLQVAASGVSDSPADSVARAYAAYAVGELDVAPDHTADAVPLNVAYALWREVALDAAMFDGESSMTATALLRYPLWHTPLSSTIEKLQHSLVATMLRHDPNTWVWSDWYNRRLSGADNGLISDSLLDDAMTRWLASRGENFWSRDSREVNTEIAGWIEQARKREALPEPEPQNSFAPAFSVDPDGSIDLDARTGNDEIQRDEEAADRHAEAVAAVARALPALSSNAAVGTRQALLSYRDALGSTIDTMRPALVILRGEALRQELRTRQHEDADNHLPPITAIALLSLQMVVVAHNLLVGLDPILARLDQAAIGEPRLDRDTAVDFFVSYARADEAMAREIVDILDGAGYSSIVQFRDFVPGTNFVREMQRGLAASGRLIALLSPAYEASDHCQAEWSAAYAEDPGARNGKIVPFKIAAGEINKLARQIVYRSLIGLDAAERRVAVLETLGHWRETLDKAASIAVPDIAVENGRITVRPGSSRGAPALSDPSAAERARLLQHVARIRDTYPDNAIRRPLRYIQDYASHLECCGNAPDVEWLSDCEFPFRRAFEASDRREWPDGFPEDAEGFFARHKRFVRHFDLAPRERALAEFTMDPKRATGKAISDPMRAVGEAVRDMSQNGLTTPEFDATIERQIEIAEHLDDSISDNPDAKAANDAIKARFLFNQIGFYERLLVAAAAMATIASASAPAVVAAIPVIERAISQLLALLL